jgi:hypothetical protein
MVGDSSRRIWASSTLSRSLACGLMMLIISRAGVRVISFFVLLDGYAKGER